jgi:hypothetical protein
MPTLKEYRQQAEQCQELAKGADQLYAKTLLLELANDFRNLAQELERGKRAD